MHRDIGEKVDKNIIVLVVDSLSYECMCGTYKDLKAPFLNKLAKDNFFATKMYSEAPYTEAAVGGLMAGQHTLDYGGYLRGFNDSPVNIFEVFKKNGYKVYNSSNTPHMHTDIWMRGVDDTFYHGTPDSRAIKSYRLDYYSNLHSRGELNEVDYVYIIDLLEGFFKNQISMISKIKNNSEETDLINDAVIGYDFNQLYEMWTKENDLFVANKKRYINNLLANNGCNFYNLPNIELNNKIKKEESKDKFVEIFKDVYKKIYIKQKRLNERNNKYNFRIINEALNTFLKSPSKKTFRDFLKTIYLNYEAKHRFEFKKWFTRDYGSIKNAPSFVLHYKHLIEWLDKNNDKKTFAYLHFDDFHNPSAFFTYDSEDEEVLRNEAQDILNYLKTLHKNYKGNVVTDLSLLYVDKQIENFFKELEKRNLLDSTTVLITADHGYPYNLYPIREDYGNAMYLENYHVPCIIVDKEYKNAICDTYQSTYDVPATLCDIANIDKPKEFIGNSIVKKHEGKDCVIFEYLGGGCPDLSRRPIHYGCFNEKMFIKVIVNINDEITEKNIVKVFDLEKDPLEYKNLVKKIKMNDERVQFLLSKLKTRHSNIIKV